MKKLIISFGILAIFSSSFAITKEEALKKATDYIGSKDYVINICENNKYYIAEVNLKGYENVSTLRKVYINKETGDILPEMAQAHDFCYMLNK